MKQFSLTIKEPVAYADVKQVLTQHFRFSARLIKRLKETENGILLNGVPVTVRTPLKAGDVLTLSLPDEASAIVPTEMPLDILYEDEDILLVNKQKGMPTHPVPGNREHTLANGVCWYYRNAPFVFRPVNRLDRDTTGIVLIAKNAYSAQQLFLQMKARKIQKTYFAITEGVPKPDQGVIDAPIKRKEGSILERTVSFDGQEAVTVYETLAEKDGLALVRATPKTGRTHQIRVHLAFIGCPLYGDFLYGTEKNESFFLHCQSMTFDHPVTGRSVTVSCPPPFTF